MPPRAGDWIEIRTPQGCSCDPPVLDRVVSLQALPGRRLVTTPLGTDHYEPTLTWVILGESDEIYVVEPHRVHLLE